MLNIGAMPMPPATKRPPPGASSKSIEKEPWGPSTQARVPTGVDPIAHVKSPSSLIANSIRPRRSALDEKEKGCSATLQGEQPILSQANCPGANSIPAWPTGESATVHVEPPSGRISATAYG